MKIYTKTGDQGQTGLYGGARVSKDHLRIHAYGTLDELNACLGMALADKGLPKKLQGTFERIQSELFQLGAELATPADKTVKSDLIEDQHIVALEKEIDEMEAKLKPLKNFILPGGTPAAARIHFARAVSRRAERELVTLHLTEAVRPAALQYVNRLADHLFVCARFANHLAKKKDIPWIAPTSNKKPR